MEYLLLATLTTAGIWSGYKLLIILFNVPHIHRYKTHDYPCVRYAKCDCGSGISIDEAVEAGIKIYAHEGYRLF